MSERDTISFKQAHPATVESLVDDLRALGLRAGMVVLVHSSMSSLGWVCGAQQAVILALIETLTDDGTLVMPAFSGANSDPAHWQNPPVPEGWWQPIRDHMPAFDPALTPTRAVGLIPEAFRTLPGAIRSAHPACSFAAWGRHARAITDDHRLDSRLGEHSPLGRIYELDGHVLLLGVGHDRNTSLHLAEYRAEWSGKRMERQGAAVQTPTGRAWAEWDDLSMDEDDFADVGAAFAESGEVVTGRVANATCQLMRQRAIVDHGVAWMTAHRGQTAP
ncbi:MAG: aminoglycoside N(3)-acetyltransferase [Planctomycetota bacterium]